MLDASYRESCTLRTDRRRDIRRTVRPYAVSVGSWLWRALGDLHVRGELSLEFGSLLRSHSHTHKHGVYLYMNVSIAYTCVPVYMFVLLIYVNVFVDCSHAQVP